MRIVAICFSVSLLIGAGAAVAQDPDVVVCEPNILHDYPEPRGLSPVVDISLCYGSGVDDALPASYRYKITEAWDVGSGTWIDSKYAFDQSGGPLVSFDSEGWTEWIPWIWPPLEPTGFRIEGLDATTPGGERKYYLLALQVQDENGSLSTELVYDDQVHHFYINELVTPALDVRETFLGRTRFTGLYGQVRCDVSSGQILEFEWFGTADGYGGTVESYRWGWDVGDPDDPLDPGWAVEPGTSAIHTSAPSRAFDSGLHTLTIHCRDAAGMLTRARYEFSVVPVPDLADRKPLLLIDDTPDKASAGWPDAIGLPRDSDGFRDQFWADVLSNVDGWTDGVDVVDAEVDRTWGIREAVEYRMLLWHTKKGVTTYIDGGFTRPMAARAYVWLESYVQSVGNLFMVGASSMQNFEPCGYQGLPWLYPVIYDTDEGVLQDGGITYALGLGTMEAFDGGVENVGTMSFPFRSMGLSVSSPTVPSAFLMTADDIRYGVFEVKHRCAGAKGLRLDPDFVAANGWAFGIDETVMTDAVIDYADDPDQLGLNWYFGANDEFYDTNITARTTPWLAQTLPDGSPAIEPMWRAYTRYDWILDTQIAAGNTDFPGDLDIASSAYCGAWAVDPATGRTRNDGVPLGVISHKTTAGKPSGRPDVLWGFDPYRFDNEAMGRAIRQVLKGNFGLEVAGVVANEPDPIAPPPTRTMLHPCRPNPFNPSTTVMFETAKLGQVSLRVVDVRGRHVKTLLDEVKGAGVFEAVWKGRDDAGRPMPAGAYFVRMVTEDARETRRMVLLK